MQQPLLVRRTVAVLAALTIGATLALSAPAAAAPPTASPTLTSPTDGTTVTANPVLTWDGIEGVTKYRVQVSASASFSSNLWSVDATNVSATPPTELPVGTVYWRVAGMNGSDVGPYAVGQFTKGLAAGPTLTAPADGAEIEFPATPVVLRWDTVPNVKTYKVEIDDAADFIGATSITTEATSYAPLDPQAIGQDFFWRVQGLSVTNGANTEYSATRQYRLAWASGGSALAPVLTSPANSTTVTDVAFRWNPVPGAAKYQLQVSSNEDFTNNIAIDTTVKGTSYSPATTLGNTGYFWRVRALDAKATPNTGPWSEKRQFTRQWADIPTLTGPADGSNAVGTYLLEWTPVPWASAYEVQVGSDANFSPNTFKTCVTTHTDWTPYRYETPVPGTPNLPGTCPLQGDQDAFTPMGKRTYWRVRGLDQSAASITPTVNGQFSAVNNFIYLPGVPTPTAPTGTVTVPKLTWAAVPKAEKYEVDIFKNGDLVRESETYGTSYVPSLEHKATDTQTTFTWSVRAVDFEARVGPVASGGTFTLQKVEPGGASLDLVAPASGASTYRQPELDWAPIDGATSYEVRLFEVDSPIYTRLYDTNLGSEDPLANPRTSAFTPITPIAPGPYEWQIVAYGPGGSLATSARRPITIASLPAAVPTAPANCVQGQACATNRATPLMRWNDVDDASMYRVYVALDPAFTNVQRIYLTTQNALRPDEAFLDNQAGQSFYWFAQPCQSKTSCGRFDSGVWGSAFAFRKASRPVVLSSPANGSSVADLTTFTWQPSSAAWTGDPNDDVAARTYKIQVSTNPDFTSILETAEVDQTTYTPHAKTYPEGPLYWRVQARDGTGNYLTQSETWLVTKASPAPTTTSPTDGATVSGLPVLRWNAQNFAAAYDVEVYKNADTTWATANRVVNTRTKLAGATLSQALPLGTYAWRVRRVDVDSLAGTWSPARLFTVTGTAPTLTSPVDGTAFTHPVVRLEWTPVAGAVTYLVETSASSSVAPAIESQSTVQTAWSLVKPYPNSTIYWRVKAVDARGNVIGTSSVGNLVHDLRRPSAAITAAKPGPTSALIVWTATPSAAVGPITSFKVQSLIGTTPGPSVVVAGDQRSARMVGLVNDTTYRFTVTPTDADGVGTTSAQSASVKPTKLAPFTSVDRLITRQFLDLFGRNPTSQELADWRLELANGRTAYDLIDALWKAPAHDGIMPPVSRLYSAFFDRIPDYSGVNYWAGKRRKGTKLDQIASSFAASSEFLTKYGPLTNREFVRNIYVDVLDRTEDTTGALYWTRQLDNKKKTRGQVMVQFSESNEYKTKQAKNTTAAVLYFDMLRRAPSVDERDAVVARITGGASFKALVADLYLTLEYAARAS